MVETFKVVYIGILCSKKILFYLDERFFNVHVDENDSIPYMLGVFYFSIKKIRLLALFKALISHCCPAKFCVLFSQLVRLIPYQTTYFPLVPLVLDNILLFLMLPFFFN